GPGTVFVNTANSFVGDARVLSGARLTQNDAALGHPDNRIVLDGGALLSQYGTGNNVTFVTHREIHVGLGGGTLGAHFQFDSFGDTTPINLGLPELHL